MDMTRLHTLAELARCATMAATADALGLTPSAVSQQISALEDEVGIALTQRYGRDVRLTPAGEVLVRHTQHLLGVLDEARAELAQLKDDIAGNLRVAAFASVAVTLMPPVITQLAAQYPRLHIQLEEMEPNEGLTALGAWRSDVALIDDLSILVGARHEHYAFIPLMEDSLSAIVSEYHALARQSTCTLADLRGEAWALDVASSAFSVFVHRLCAQVGFAPRINATARSFEVILEMVAAGCSVSVAPGLWLKRPAHGVKTVALLPETGRKISAAYRRGERHHPAITVFLDAIQKVSANVFAQSIPQAPQ